MPRETEPRQADDADLKGFHLLPEFDTYGT
jgi:hypothetical protein